MAHDARRPAEREAVAHHRGGERDDAPALGEPAAVGAGPRGLLPAGRALRADRHARCLAAHRPWPPAPAAAAAPELRGAGRIHPRRAAGRPAGPRLCARRGHAAPARIPQAPGRAGGEDRHRRHAALGAFPRDAPGAVQLPACAAAALSARGEGGHGGADQDGAGAVRVAAGGAGRWLPPRGRAPLRRGAGGHHRRAQHHGPAQPRSGGPGGARHRHSVLRFAVP